MSFYNRHTLGLDFYAPKHAGLRHFVEAKIPGDFQFTNDNHETYIMTQTEQGTFTLSYPQGDYSGDPAVVDSFNAMKYGHLL